MSLVALIATFAVLGASCSTSTPTSAAKHPKAVHASAPPSTTTTIKKSKTIAGIYGNGSSITGNSGVGTNTGQGIAVPGTLVTPGATSTTVAGDAPTTTTAGVDPNIAAMTGPAPGSAASPAPVYVTKTGRVLHRHLAPTISKFRPLSGVVGATVVIFGKRLSDATSVAFDGIPATISSNSSTRIRAVVPTGATTGPISVVTVGGSATVSGFVVG